MPWDGDIPIAESYADLERHGDLFGAQDGDGVFYVAPGTKVSIISRDLRCRHVRIRSGPQSGRDGWVPTEYLGPRK